jgi:plastocyanin
MDVTASRTRPAWVPSEFYPFEDRYAEVRLDLRDVTTVKLEGARHYIQEDARGEIVAAIRECAEPPSALISREYRGSEEDTMHICPRAARPIIAVLTVTALAITGCGGGGEEEATPTSSPKATPTTVPKPSAGAALSLQADKSQLKFDKSALSAKPGKVTIVMKNPSPLPHDVAIEGNGVEAKGKIVNQGGTSTATATLKAGTYTFYCSVDNHRQAGMEGTLTVK